MNDKFVVRAVVIGLILVSLAGLVLMGVLALDSRAIPEAITAATSGSLGALGALLARTSVDDKPPAPPVPVYQPQHMAPQ